MDTPSTTRSRPLALVAAAILIFPLGACHSSQLGVHAPSDAAASPRGVSLTVTNDNYDDVRVYAVVGATLYPLGSVGSTSTRTFRIPTPIMGISGAVRLVADPLGLAEPFTSDWVVAAPGERIEWRLAANLKLSSFWVR